MNFVQIFLFFCAIFWGGEGRLSVLVTYHYLDFTLNFLSFLTDNLISFLLTYVLSYYPQFMALNGLLMCWCAIKSLSLTHIPSQSQKEEQKSCWMLGVWPWRGRSYARSHNDAEQSQTPREMPFNKLSCNLVRKNVKFLSKQSQPLIHISQLQQ